MTLPDQDSTLGISDVLALGGVFLVGALPFAHILARSAAGADLRTVRTGTVSASNVYVVAGPAPFALTFLLDLGKGAAMAALVRRRRPDLLAVAGGLVVAGHNWSPFLRGAGGRGVLTATGVLLVAAPEGAALVLGSAAASGLLGDTAPGCFVAQVLLVPVLAASQGRTGALLGLALALPMLVKRLVGNRGAASGRVYLTRLVYDRDVR
ncbi:hypothetical protein Aph01nite_74450 [Acrocarpospora phusangensis]|uniref:Glycerol-3-phosphate acyltransferase n=1 Tax=Acrocarpospora phusangensis TaxID=1070424 RepID=A0A919UV74_9ACTN|nr:glycerol-3-phosphate acyltransferase [Acrocarpospora phusangensis]GIH29135.1 hypothetical protein Aph01nite_74450 [Acrocarpospora phusangensis]